jgi:hypothetical protein
VRARVCYERAGAVAPRFAEAALNIGLLDLLEGRYRSGWRGFSRRWDCLSHAAFAWTADTPRWQGSIAPGSRLLLRAEPEQALGDTILFARFIPEAAARVGAVWLECDRTLHRLLTGIPGVAQVIAPGERAGPADLTCGLMDLGQLLAPEASALGAAAYLRVAPAELEHWRSLLEERPRPRIGICWRGNPRFRLDHLRSPGLAPLAPVLALAKDHLISLVHQRRSDEALPPGIADPMALVSDMADTAALIASLDLVITSDTAVAHLAGALGCPTWVLLHQPADWRWQRRGETTPWYARMRLFRQPRPGEWAEPVARLAEALMPVVSGPSARVP